MIKKVLFAVLGLTALYLLHIPALKLVSYITAPDMAEYPPLQGGITGERYEIANVFIGTIYEVAHDPQTGQYLIMGEYTDTRTESRGGYYVVTLDENGQVISEQKISSDERQTAMANPRFQDVPRLIERKYIPEYDFDDITERVTLAHYSFESYDEWPKMTMIGPMILSDWQGTAYLDIPHQDEVLRARIPTFYFGGVLYMGGSIDGQIYPRGRAGGEVSFIEVDESSFGMRMDGLDIHREGLGLYVIRPRVAP